MFRQSLGTAPRTGTRQPAPSWAVALQGGGAHGAFAWGVLDRLFEEEDGLRIAALSGASAGAVNAVVAAHGLLLGGPSKARAALRKLWTTIGQMSFLSPLGFPGGGFQVDLLTRMVSPYQFNPLNLNPMRDLLEEMVDFDLLRRETPIPLFISTTHVRTGRPRIFREHEITADVLMASTCIPHLHQAVTIEGEAYWDGGLSANPPILPLVLDTDCDSLLVVKLTPRDEPTPTAASDILARMRRIMFNALLERELDALAEMRTLLKQQEPLPEKLKRVRDLDLHSLAITHGLVAESSALNTRPDLLARLHDAGYAAADPVPIRAAARP